MNFELNEEQLMVKSSVREFAQNEIAPKSREYDEAEKFPAQQLAGYAVFGEAGEATAVTDLEILETMDIPRFLLDELARELGIVVLPRIVEES